MLYPDRRSTRKVFKGSVAVGGDAGIGTERDLHARIVRAAQRVRTSAREITVPVLTVHGEADPLCRVEGSHDFCAELEPSGCEFRTYPGLLHEVLNEPEREQVLAEIHDWLEKRVTLGRPA